MALGIFGVILIVAGIGLQVYERHRTKNHAKLVGSIKADIDALLRAKEQTRKLSGIGGKLPGSGTSTSDVKNILQQAEEAAKMSSQETSQKIAEAFEAEEREREPFYLLSYLLVAAGTVLIVLWPNSALPG